MNNKRKQLGIRDKDIRSMQLVTSTTNRTDTVVFRDTILADGGVSTDTVLGDTWYTLRLGLRYPDTIEVSPSFRSRK